MSKTPVAFPALLQVIKDKFNLPARANGEAGSKLGYSRGRTSQCLNNPPVSERTWKGLYRQLWKLAYTKGVREGRRETTGNLLKAVAGVLGTTKNKELAKAFQVTNPAITHWKQGKSAPTVTSTMKLLQKRAKLRIKTLAELASIEPNTKGKGWWIDQNADRREKWRTTLQGRKGIYIFYDSLGRVTYVGKTSVGNNDLFKEIEQRLRTAELRGIHFGKGMVKLKDKQKPRQGNIAKMISVYEIIDVDSIQNIEALLIRAFMNTHFNKRVEKFK